MPEPFTLRREPAQRRPQKTLKLSAPLVPETQGKLFAGSTCLPGQRSLVSSDGPRLPVGRLSDGDREALIEMIAAKETDNAVDYNERTKTLRYAPDAELERRAAQ